MIYWFELVEIHRWLWCGFLLFIFQILFCEARAFCEQVMTFRWVWRLRCDCSSSVISFAVSSKGVDDLWLKVAGQAHLLTCSEVVEVSIEVERHFTLGAAIK